MLNHLILDHFEMLNSKKFPDEVALFAAQECTANEWVPRDLLPARAMLPRSFGLPMHENTATRYKKLEQQALDPDVCIGGICSYQDAKRARDEADAAVVAAQVVGNAYEGLTAKEREGLDVTIRTAMEGPVVGDAPGARSEPISRKKGSQDWRRVLRNFVMKELEQEFTTSRPSRRLPHLVGIVPGRQPVAKKLKRLMVAIDTSGSMTARLLAMAFAELRPLSRFAELIVVQCDAVIHDVSRFDGKPPTALGRGGTDLRPPFELIGRLQVDGVIYFTDGMGFAPAEPPRVPVLWGLTPGGMRPVPWGQVTWLTAGSGPTPPQSTSTFSELYPARPSAPRRGGR
jgi:hypothetical protein